MPQLNQGPISLDVFTLTVTKWYGKETISCVCTFIPVYWTSGSNVDLGLYLKDLDVDGK